jgi:hypothetical protein
MVVVGHSRGTWAAAQPEETPSPQGVAISHNGDVYVALAQLKAKYNSKDLCIDQVRDLCLKTKALLRRSRQITLLVGLKEYCLQKRHTGRQRDVRALEELLDAGQDNFLAGSWPKTDATKSDWESYVDKLEKLLHHLLRFESVLQRRQRLSNPLSLPRPPRVSFATTVATVLTSLPGVNGLLRLDRRLWWENWSALLVVVVLAAALLGGVQSLPSEVVRREAGEVGEPNLHPSRIQPWGNISGPARCALSPCVRGGAVGGRLGSCSQATAIQSGVPPLSEEGGSRPYFFNSEPCATTLGCRTLLCGLLFWSGGQDHLNRHPSLLSRGVAMGPETREVGEPNFLPPRTRPWGNISGPARCVLSPWVWGEAAEGRLSNGSCSHLTASQSGVPPRSEEGGSRPYFFNSELCATTLGCRTLLCEMLLWSGEIGQVRSHSAYLCQFHKVYSQVAKHRTFGPEYSSDSEGDGPAEWALTEWWKHLSAVLLSAGASGLLWVLFRWKTTDARRVSEAVPQSTGRIGEGTPHTSGPIIVSHEPLDGPKRAPEATDTTTKKGSPATATRQVTFEVESEDDIKSVSDSSDVRYGDDVSDPEVDTDDEFFAANTEGEGSEEASDSTDSNSLGADGYWLVGGGLEGDKGFWGAVQCDSSGHPDDVFWGICPCEAVVEFSSPQDRIAVIGTCKALEIALGFFGHEFDHCPQIICENAAVVELILSGSHFDEPSSRGKPNVHGRTNGWIAWAASLVDRYGERWSEEGRSGAPITSVVPPSVVSLRGLANSKRGICGGAQVYRNNEGERQSGEGLVPTEDLLREFEEGDPRLDVPKWKAKVREHLMIMWVSRDTGLPTWPELFLHFRDSKSWRPGQQPLSAKAFLRKYKHLGCPDLEEAARALKAERDYFSIVVEFSALHIAKGCREDLLKLVAFERRLLAGKRALARELPWLEDPSDFYGRIEDLLGQSVREWAEMYPEYNSILEETAAAERWDQWPLGRISAFHPDWEPAEWFCRLIGAQGKTWVTVEEAVWYAKGKCGEYIETTRAGSWSPGQLYVRGEVSGALSETLRKTSLVSQDGQGANTSSGSRPFYFRPLPTLRRLRAAPGPSRGLQVVKHLVKL